MKRNGTGFVEDPVEEGRHGANGRTNGGSKAEVELENGKLGPVDPNARAGDEQEKCRRRKMVVR